MLHILPNELQYQFPEKIIAISNKGFYGLIQALSTIKNLIKFTIDPPLADAAYPPLLHFGVKDVVVSPIQF